MNRRIRNKIEKKVNLHRQEAILSEIAKQFTVDKKVYGSGSMFYYMGLNGLCHFSLKETPGWRYGIWLNKKGYEIFGEHVDLLDKFDPDHTYICLTDVQSFVERIQNVSEKPEMYFVDSLTGGDVFVDYEERHYGQETVYKGYQVVKTYNKESYRWDFVGRDLSMTQEAFVKREYESYQAKKAEKMKNQELDRIQAFQFFKELPNLFEEIVAVGIADGNKGGSRSTPRYTLSFVMDKAVSQERSNELFDAVDKVVEERNKARRTRAHLFSLYASFDRLTDIKTYDYKFFKSVASA